MRKTIPAWFIVVAFLFPFVLLSCTHIWTQAPSTQVPVDSDKDGVFDNYDYRYDLHFITPQYYDKCPTSTPAGVKVDKYGCPIDSDVDGVPDYLDKCPGTPAGVKVDNYGCPLDEDKDGVPDYLDKCPGTPAGAKVDNNGCPLDSDGDGVPDYLDKCPGTPAGVKVDKDGCPLDSDGDGLPDYLDKCPGTPAGVKVDKDGCPIDSDGDGVPDYLDKCPGSTKGMAVDINGCPIAAAVQEKSRVTLKVLFDFDKAVVKNQYHNEIGNLAEMMKKYPEITIQIEGYTDSVGDAKYNEKLSQRRADAIRKYLVEKFGIAGSRLTAIGYGESRPVASNDTKDGREKNRRVEAVAEYSVKK